MILMLMVSMARRAAVIKIEEVKNDGDSIADIVNIALARINLETTDLPELITPGMWTWLRMEVGLCQCWYRKHCS